MIGGVASLELRRAARRGQHHRLRTWLAVALFAVAAVALLLLWSRANPIFPRLRPPPTPEALGRLVAAALQGLVLLQLALVVLVAPAFAAGSVSDEKTTGTLQHLLTTPLESRHIIVGKWLAQMAQSALLVSPAVPLTVLLARRARLHDADLAALALLPFVPLPALTAASLLSSVWARATPSAIARLYLLLALAGLGAWWFGLLDRLGPGGVIAASLAGDGTAWREMALLLLAWAAPVVPCLLLACWRLRPAYRAELEGRGRSPRREAFRALPPVGNQPLRWKERYAGERTALPLLGEIPAVAGQVLVFALTALVFGCLAFLSWHDAVNRPLYADAVVWLGLSVMMLAALLVAVRCAGSVSAERERQTWDLLLLTPLEPRHILRGKLWGNIDLARPYLLIYLAVALAPALAVGVQALFWLALTWLAAWVVMYFAGATGLECSARGGGSWRALLRALLSSSGLVLQRYLTIGVPCGFAGGMLGGALGTAIYGGLPNSFLFNGFLLGSFVPTVAVLLAQAERSLEQAEGRIAQEERVPQGERRGLVRDVRS